MGQLFGPLIKPVLYSEKPFKRSLPTDKSFVMTGDKDFEAEKQKLITLVADFTEQTIIDLPHPLFGKMTKEQWSKATWKHLDHHLQQFGV